MKSTALLIALLIGLASCHFRFFEASEPAPEEIGGKKNDISDFFTGVFGHFNLSSPAQIIDCFNNINAGLYFNLVQEINRILEDTKERSSLQLHFELIKLAFLDQSLKQTQACMIMTQDFTDLLDALDIAKREPSLFEMYLYIYYQAHYLDLFEGFKPVIDNLNIQSNSAAGDAFGTVISDIVSTIKQEGSYHLSFAAFGNGAAITLDIDEPSDSLQCYDENASKLYLEFTYGIAAAVSEGSIEEASLNAYKYWDREGKQLMSEIPQSVFECEAQSNDIQNINAKVGLDVSSEDFLKRMLKFINDDRLAYYMLMKTMRRALEHHNFHHAGSVHAHFLREIARNTK